MLAGGRDLEERKVRLRFRNRFEKCFLCTGL